MKVLIYFDKKMLKPIGGPSGYLFNLKKELDEENIDYIDFIDTDVSLKRKIFGRLPKKITKIIKKIYNPGPREILKKVYSNKPKITNININNYDIIHFHSALSMYLVKDSLKDYKGKIIFTSHTPKVSYKEICEDMTSKDFYLKNKEKFDGLEIIDEYAFNRADYILFPTPESEECYMNTWSKYNVIKKNNAHKYIYNPTGIKEIHSKLSKQEIRKKYNIPMDAFVVSFVGRHNIVKGYDLLKKIGNKIISSNNNIYFLIAGEEKPIEGLNNAHWIEVGWTDDPHSIINAADLFILPNKETYFDLILLEVMALGKQVLITNTGGNKYFKKYKSKSISYFEYGDVDGAIEKIKNNMAEDDYGYLNELIFKKNFKIDIFTNNYIKLLKKINKGEV